MSKQLEIEGIGQQKKTLAMWKSENGIYTHSSPHMEHKWTCWDEIECPLEFISTYGDSAMGFGKTEREAIESFCEKENIEKPFWW